MKRPVLFLLIVSLFLSLIGCGFFQGTSRKNLFEIKDFDERINFENWLYPAYIRRENGIVWGYINASGEFIITPKYEEAQAFQQNGFAIIQKDGLKGLIDLEGRELLPSIYKEIRNFEEGISIINYNNEYKVINENGNILFESNRYIYDFNDGLATFTAEKRGKELYGYIDNKGKVVIPPKYIAAQDFVDGLAIVRDEYEQNLLIDKSGNTVAELEHDIVMGLSEETIVYLAENTNKYGYLDISGKILIEAEFSHAESFKNGLAVVSKVDDDGRNKYGLMNKNGELVLNSEHDFIRKIGENLYIVSEPTKELTPVFNLKKAIVNNNGEFITEYNFFEAEYFNEELVYVNDKESTYLIDLDGNKLTTFPKINGVGSLKPQGYGSIVEANIDNRLNYYTIDGDLIWKDERTFIIEGDLSIEERKYRPNRNLLVYYPQLVEHTNLSLQEKVNAKIRNAFHIDSLMDDSGEHDDIVEINFTVQKNKNIIIIEKYGYYYYIGDARGNHSKDHYHINYKTGEFYTLKNLFYRDSDYRTRLKEIIKKQIEEAKNIDDSIIYYDDIMVRELHPFNITDKYLQIYFYPYEIAPYAAGFPIFNIPYEDIIDIINTDGDFWNSIEASDILK